MGTPFRHLGRLRGRAVDCVGLPLCVMRDLGIADWMEDFRVYPRQPMTDRVLEVCKKRLREKEFKNVQPGDVLVFRAPIVACHAAIASDIGIIHAYSPAGNVVEHRIDEKWKRRLAGCFNPPGIDDHG
jgi:cell wall-associated NlpC family hydrolase